jgi:hypothetical protein
VGFLTRFFFYIFAAHWVSEIQTLFGSGRHPRKSPVEALGA